jgi:2-polyprenyl-6-methoxyphenol hydroxylase-like FAD-dependent oxidoreductase
LEGYVHNSAVTTPHIHELLKGGKIFAFGYAHVLVVSSKGSGDLTFYPSFRADENWVQNNGLNYSDKVQVLAWFKNEFAEWSHIWHELFENAVTPFIPRPVICMPLDQNWETLPNLTMLGDAAHVMPPFAGEGVNMAMLDALELSECLISSKFSTLQDAISGFEVRMRKRAAEAAQESLDNGEWMHSDKGLIRMLEGPIS